MNRLCAPDGLPNCTGKKPKKLPVAEGVKNAPDRSSVTFSLTVMTWEAAETFTAGGKMLIPVTVGAVTSVGAEKTFNCVGRLRACNVTVSREVKFPAKS